jgi:hypothetical protein
MGKLRISAKYRADILESSIEARIRKLAPFQYRWAWRNSLGVIPVTCRNAAENELVRAKPSAMAMLVTDNAEHANNLFARSIRR